MVEASGTIDDGSFISLRKGEEGLEADHLMTGRGADRQTHVQAGRHPCLNLATMNLSVST